MKLKSPISPAAGPMAPAQEAQAPGNQDLDPQIMQQLDQRMNELPDPQKQFVLKYAQAPEIAGLLGIILGNEGLAYFSQFADPAVTLQVTPRQDQQQAPVDPQGPMAMPVQQ